MAHVSISEAARLAGKHRTTIQRHIKSGKLSATQDLDGNPAVDVAELSRVYGNLPGHAAPVQQSQSSTLQQAAQDVAAGEIEVLRAKLEAAETAREIWKQQAEREARRADELLEMLKQEQQNIRLLAPSSKPSEQETKKSSRKRSIGQRFVAWWDGVG